MAKLLNVSFQVVNPMIKNPKNRRRSSDDCLKIMREAIITCWRNGTEFNIRVYNKAKWGRIFGPISKGLGDSEDLQGGVRD